MTQMSHNSTSLIRTPRAFARCSAGATAIEYALIALGLSMAIAAIIPVLGASVADMYNLVAGAI